MATQTLVTGENGCRVLFAQVATVLQAESDDDERVVDLEKYHLDCSDVEESDVMAVIDNRRLAVVVNLTDCKR